LWFQAEAEPELDHEEGHQLAKSIVESMNIIKFVGKLKHRGGLGHKGRMGRVSLETQVSPRASRRCSCFFAADVERRLVILGRLLRVCL